MAVFVVRYDLAAQFRGQRTRSDLGHRVAALRVGRVATEKNQSSSKGGIKFPTFFVPDSSVPSTTMTKRRSGCERCLNLHAPIFDQS
jgi:hypothetical protein